MTAFMRTRPGQILIAVCGSLALLLVLIFPFRSLYYQQRNIMAVPSDLDETVVKYYADQGFTMESHSQWALLRYLKAGPQYVVTSDALATSAQKANKAGIFIRLYPETVVVGWKDTGSPALKLTEFTQLIQRHEQVYLDQGVSRLELMAALSLNSPTSSPAHQSRRQSFDSSKGLRLLSALHRSGRLEVGKTLGALSQAMSRGALCLTTDTRLASLSGDAAPSRYVVPHTLLYWRGVWERNPHLNPESERLRPLPSNLLSAERFPSLSLLDSPAGTSNPYNLAHEVSNIAAFQDFVWEMSRVDQSYGVSTNWQASNENFKLAGFIVTLGIIVFWAAWRFWTSSSAFVRRAVLLQALLFACWILARILKHATMGAFERYCWYFYYVPIISTLVIIFFVTNHSIFPRLPGYKVLSRVVVVIWGCLLLGVFTNDLHHQLLIIGRGDTKVDYAYGPLYYVYYLVVVVLSIGIIATLLRGLRGHWRKLLYLVLPLVALGFTYSALYTMRVWLIRGTENVEFYILMFLLLWEMLYLIGILKQNFGYVDFFNDSTVPIRILDSNWKTRFSTTSTAPLNKKILRGLQLGNNPYTFKVSKQEDSGFVSQAEWRVVERPLQGGHVLYAIDLSQVRELEMALTRLRKQEKQQTDMLTIEYESLEEFGFSRKLQGLYNRLEELMQSSLDEVLAEAKHLDGSLPESAKRRALRSIKLHLGYAKRASLLVLQSTEKQTVSLNLLTTFLSQACTDFSSRDVHVGLKGPIEGYISQGLALSVLEATYRTFKSALDLRPAVGFLRFDLDSQASRATLSWAWDVQLAAFPQLATILDWPQADSSLERVEDAFHLTTVLCQKGES